ncbi:MAG: ABC transporter ATP-binding protein [Lentimicrobium sp.]|nr:ABC transporter ATP-binding protein [Lentimicrobium sp.]
MIEIHHLSKSFGKHKVLDDISLKIEQGSVYALLGKNGAGKTTLINIIVDLVQPDSGTILINNQPHHSLSRNDKANIGQVGEDLALIEEFSGYEFLSFIGKIYKIPPGILEKRLHDLFDYFFEDVADLKKGISTYSTGMKKKIAFCATVLHTPDILILDEPFSGLDPLVANQMIAFLKMYSTKDRTIFISSHDLNYVEKIATHIGVLDKAHLQFDATLESFTQHGQNALDRALLKILNPNETDVKTIDWL